MQTQNKKPFQIIHRFIDSVKQRHRSESVRKSGNMNFFSDDELLVIAHLEQAATDLRCANIELIQRAKEILSQSPAVTSYGEFRRYLLGCVELLLVEATARQRNPALYDFLHHDRLWYFDNMDALPAKVRGEIAYYLAYGSPDTTPEEERKLHKKFNKIVEYFRGRHLGVKEFIYEKVRQMPDHELRDFISSRDMNDLIVKWHGEYVDTYTSVSMHSFENRACEVKRELRNRGKKQNGR